MFSVSQRNVLSTTLYLIVCSIVFLLAVSWPTDVHAAPLAQTDGQNLRIVDRRGGQTGDAVVEGNYAYTIVGTRLLVLDLSNPATPTKVGTLVLSYPVLDMVINNGLIYVSAGSSGLHIISVTDPAYPVEIGTYPGSYGDGIALQGHYVYLFDATHFYVIDVVQPASPVQAGVYTAPDGISLGKKSLYGVVSPGKPMAIQGNYAYLLSSEGLTIFDLANPTTPQRISAIATSSSSTALILVENLAYISWNGGVVGGYPPHYTSSGGLEIVDVSNPLVPLTKSVYQPIENFEANQIAVYGTHVYLDGEIILANSDHAWVTDRTQIVNAADPEHPMKENGIDIDSQSTLIVNDHLYALSGEKGLQILSLSTPVTPTLLSSFNDGLAYASLNMVGRQDSLLYAVGGGGMQILDISAPGLPTLGSLPVGGTLFAIDENRAYLGWVRTADFFGEDYGISIVDVTNSALPTFVTDYGLGRTYMGGTTSALHAKTVANHRLYTSNEEPPALVNVDPALYIIDLTSPTSPTLLGTYATLISTMLVNGNYAYLADKPTGITILDVAAATTPTLLSTYSAIGAVQLFATSNSYLLAASEDGLHILDVSNPTALVEIGHVPSITQTQYLVTDGDYAYLSVPNDGLHVLDLVDPAHPTEVAFYPGIGALQVVPGMDNKLYVAAGANGLLTLQLSGTIAGKVVDSLGKPYTGVKVTLSDGQSTETNAQGDYSFTSLTPGSHTVNVESSTYDFQPTEQTLRVPSYASNSLNFTLLPKALSAAVTSASPAHLSYKDLQGNSIDFDVPAGAVTQPTIFNVLPQASAAAPGQYFTGVRFDLQTGEASSAGTPFTFAAPLTITLHYTDSAVAPVADKNQLLLLWWDGSQWTDATTTCTAATPALHDLASRVLTTTVCQSGQFALFGPTVQYFLPLVSRSQAATSEMRGRFVAQHSGKCLNVLAESQQNWGSIIQWPCAGGDNEIWTVRQQGEYAQIVAKHSQKCLNVSNVSQAEGAQVIQYSCSGGDNELWRLLPVGGNLYQIVAKHSNQCLTVQDASLEDKAQVIQRNCSGSPNQIWRLEVHN